MASKSTISVAFFLVLNLLFFSLVSASGTCIDSSKIGACAKVLGGLVDVTIGNPPVTPCCPLIAGLADLEAAVCLCTVLKTNVLGLVRLNTPIDLSLVLNNCGANAPKDFQCVV